MRPFGTALAIMSLCLLIATRAVAQQPQPAMASADGTDGESASSQIQGLRDYVARAGTLGIPQLGIWVSNGSAPLQSGKQADGVAVVGLIPSHRDGRRAPLRGPRHQELQGALMGASMVAALFFPPAIIGVAILGDLGNRYGDLIIGVDGYRIKNILDLAQAIAQDKPGDVVYVVVVREGRRIQLRVRLR